MPFIAWWPGKITPGSESAAPAITLDIMPTLLSQAGLNLPENLSLDGVDLSPLLLNGEAPTPRPLYWASMSNRGMRSEAMRESRWKLVVNHPKAKPGTFDNEQVELYHLDQDPGETQGLAQQQPARTQAMLRRLKGWFANTQRTATPQLGGW